MHFSGILVLSRPEYVEACIRDVEALAGVEVHHVEEETGRFIAVLESPGLEGQEEGLRRIQMLDRVIAAALVNHRFDEEILPAGTVEGEGS